MSLTDPSTQRQDVFRVKTQDSSSFRLVLRSQPLIRPFDPTSVKMQEFYGLRGTKLNIAIAIIAGLDFALFGYDQGVMGGLLTLPSFLSLFPQINTQSPPPGWSSSRASNVQGITVGAYTLGCFFGAVATIWLGNFLGRKKTIFIGSSIMIVGAIIQASSFSLGQLIAARLITGFGNGSFPFGTSFGGD